MTVRDQQDLRLTPDDGMVAKPQSAHIAVLRAARVRHKTIARGLQAYFDAIAAEKVPDDFFALLNGSDLEQAG